MSDNKTLRTEYSRDFYVVLVSPPDFDGLKLVAKNHFARHAFNHTMLIGKAMRFDTVKLAQRFVENQIEYWSPHRPMFEMFRNAVIRKVTKLSAAIDIV